MKWFADLGQPYFDYMSCALRKGQPTVLAKIFGVYGLSFSNKGRHKKMNVMVMENIYYKKTITKQFDLKGSTRNRFVEVQAGKNCVLLDENLVNRELPARHISGTIRYTDACSFRYCSRARHPALCPPAHQGQLGDSPPQ